MHRISLFDVGLVPFSNVSFIFLEAGDNGKGIAIIRSKVTFDREEQKFYYLPIRMEDMRGHGQQSSLGLTSTTTLTIEITDINDNPHYPAHQNIHVYNYKGQYN